MREAQQAPTFVFEKEQHRAFYTSRIRTASLELCSDDLLVTNSLKRQGTYTSFPLSSQSPPYTEDGRRISVHSRISFHSSEGSQTSGQNSIVQTQNSCVSIPTKNYPASLSS